jgi:hypothetical protein
VRVAVDARLASARIRVKIDVNVGDPVWPEPDEVETPRLLDEGAVRLRGYPLPMVYAEKIVTAVARGQANTRWRDFADIYVLSGDHNIDGRLIQEAVSVVAEHRGVQLAPLSDGLRGYAEREQSRWARWRAKHQLQPLLPDDFAAVTDAVYGFADPVLMQSVDDRTWHADRRRWSDRD